MQIVSDRLHKIRTELNLEADAAQTENVWLNLDILVNSDTCLFFLGRSHTELLFIHDICKFDFCCFYEIKCTSPPILKRIIISTFIILDKPMTIKHEATTLNAKNGKWPHKEQNKGPRTDALSLWHNPQQYSEFYFPVTTNNVRIRNHAERRPPGTPALNKKDNMIRITDWKKGLFTRVIAMRQIRRAFRLPSGN